MKISEKIARIRLEPEHIRLRYVWSSVVISMFFILAVWFFSLGSLFKGGKNSNNTQASTTTNISDQLKSLKDQTPSIESIANQEGINIPAAVSNNSQNSTTAEIMTAPQTDAYLNLSTDNTNQ